MSSSPAVLFEPDVLSSGANLKGVDMEGSQMTGINLRVATLKNAKLKNCNLRGATLAGTDLEVCSAGPSQEIIFAHFHCDSAGGVSYVQQLSGDKKDETADLSKMFDTSLPVS